MQYNTEKEPLAMREYGRSVMEMVKNLKTIEDRAKRSEQAAAVVKTMEILNPQVRQQEDYRHKLWDHLFIISGFDLDIDSPYPCPVPESFATNPVPLPMKGTRIRASHYGRNIEKVLDLVAGEPEGEVKTSLVRGLATYMRQQYLIWNKDNVADETIFADITRMSDGKITVPDGMELDKISQDADFSRPSLGVQKSGRNRSKHRNKRR